MRAIALLLLATIALPIAGCSDDSTGAAATERSLMSATVGDRGLVMSSISHDRVDLKYFVSGTTTLEPPNDNIILSFDSLTAPGSYPVGAMKHGVVARYLRRMSATESEEYKGTSGTVKVEAMTETRASGTFSFYAQVLGGTKVIRITEGTFTTIRR
jgi:hypothetical protein